MVGTGAALPPRARGPPSPPPRPRRGHEAGAGGAGTRGGTERCPPAGPWTDRRGRCHRAEPEGVAGGATARPVCGRPAFQAGGAPEGTPGREWRDSNPLQPAVRPVLYRDELHSLRPRIRAGPWAGDGAGRVGARPEGRPARRFLLGHPALGSAEGTRTSGVEPETAPGGRPPDETTRRRDTCDITHEQTCAQGFGGPESSEPPGSGEAGGSRARGRRVPYATRSSRPESALLSR